eukprot:882409_1
MPLFAKPYRLSKIYPDPINGIFQKKYIPDVKLFRLIAISVMIDIILLMILTLLSPLQRLYLPGDIVSIDALRQTQYIYGSCSFDEVYFSATFWYFYGFIVLWKLCQALWGIHWALNLSRVRGQMLEGLNQFDETGSQLLSLVFTVVVIASCVPVWVFGILIQNILYNLLFCVCGCDIMAIG